MVEGALAPSSSWRSWRERGPNDGRRKEKWKREKKTIKTMDEEQSGAPLLDVDPSLLSLCLSFFLSSPACRGSPDVSAPRPNSQDPFGERRGR